MNLEQVTNQLKHLSSILERSWTERQVMRLILTEAKVPDWERRLERMMKNPELAMQAHLHFLPAIEQLDETIKAALIEELAKFPPPSGLPS